MQFGAIETTLAACQVAYAEKSGIDFLKEKNLADFSGNT